MAEDKWSTECESHTRLDIDVRLRRTRRFSVVKQAKVTSRDLVTEVIDNINSRTVKTRILFLNPEEPEELPKIPAKALFNLSGEAMSY